VSARLIISKMLKISIKEQNQKKNASSHLHLTSKSTKKNQNKFHFFSQKKERKKNDEKYQALFFSYRYKNSIISLQ
jgi:hypothetical protein